MNSWNTSSLFWMYGQKATTTTKQWILNLWAHLFSGLDIKCANEPEVNGGDLPFTWKIKECFCWWCWLHIFFLLSHTCSEKQAALEMDIRMKQPRPSAGRPMRPETLKFKTSGDRNTLNLKTFASPRSSPEKEKRSSKRPEKKEKKEKEVEVEREKEKEKLRDITEPMNLIIEEETKKTRRARYVDGAINCWFFPVVAHCWCQSLEDVLQDLWRFSM